LRRKANGGQIVTSAFDAWIGRQETATDTVTDRDAARLAATLAPDHADLGTDLPPLWHWLAFAPIVAHDGLGADGHPALGGFLPPLEGRRRMWAGGQLRFGPPLKIGEPLYRQSEITRIAEKSGATGSLVFVTVRHVVTGTGGGRVEEDQDIVYAALPDRFSPPPPVAAPDGAALRPVAVDAVKLFRFSALTFNAHRIHYDLPYAQGAEKYPGLVVHGPLQAIWMMETARRHGTPAAFRYRGLRPLFPEDAPQVAVWPAKGAARPVAVVARGGHMTMQGEVEFA
jgi:3-methylfumaryl-CoA hydratase